MDVDRELIATLDAAAAAATPATETVDLDGWLLRRTEGLGSKRPNSVWPRADGGGLALEAKLQAVERFYRDRELPVRYQVSPATAPGDLAEVLVGRGYARRSPTRVQFCAIDELADAPPAPGLAAAVQAAPGAGWWATWREALDLDPARLGPVAAMLGRVVGELAAVTVSLSGEPAAVGLGVRHGEWLGIFNMATAPVHRRRGAGRAVLVALGRWGQEHGTRSAYLQVDGDNEAGLALYRSVGFAAAYDYGYLTLAR